MNNTEKDRKIIVSHLNFRDEKNKVIMVHDSKTDSLKIKVNNYHGKLISFQIFEDLIFHTDEKGKLRSIEILDTSVKFPDYFREERMPIKEIK